MVIDNDDTLVKAPMDFSYNGYNERRDWLEKRKIRYFDYQEGGYDVFKFFNPSDATMVRLAWA